MAGYYALVASLRDLAPGGTNKDFDANEIRAYVREELKEADRQLLDFFYTWYDIENLVAAWTRSDHFNPLGNFTAEQLALEAGKPEQLPYYLARVVEAYNAPEHNQDEQVEVAHGLARSLYEAFYRQAAGSANRFVREWFAFDRSLRNISAAVAARRSDRPVEQVVVGDDAVAEALKKSTAVDFSLKGEVEYIDTLIATLTEQDDLLEKERQLDALRWSMADELTRFDYFDLQAVLAYMVKVNLVARWQRLDVQIGKQFFDHLLNQLSTIENNAI